jgi:glycosyltransferase involved in cell wall biosynthesis
MKVLALTRYGREGASSRVRFLQYLPLLAARGVEVTVDPLWDPSYLARWYRDGSRSGPHALARYARRAWRLARLARRHDVMWLEAELFPYLPGWAERALPRPFVVDYDDAVFEKYARRRFRAWLGDKIDDVMRRAAAVVAGNAQVAEHARRAGARRVEVLPTVVDPTRYPLSSTSPPPLRIAWIGTPHTARYVEQIAPALREASRRTPLKLVVIGAEVGMAGVDVETHPWSEDTEGPLLSTCHVGVMPLPDEPWERGKSGYKLIQSMAAGLPVVASPVGANRDIVTPDVGWLASTTEEWVDALVACATGERRLPLGRAARRRVEERYSVDVTAPLLADVLRAAAIPS